MWNPRFIPLLYEDLGIRPEIAAVDVGCGTGFFTRLMARGMKKRGHLVGVDIDERLLQYAQKLSSEEDFDLIEYKKGSAYDIPLPDEYSDLTVAHMLLHWLKEPLTAIGEMSRVTKAGGTVATIGVDGDIYFDPNDPRLNELDAKFDEAQVRGALALDGYDLTIARKFPALLKQAGLKEVHANAFASLELVGDATISNKEGQNRWKESLRVAKNSRASRSRNLKYALAGGMSATEYNERLSLRLQRLRKWASESLAASNDMTLSGNIIIVATGKR